LGFAQGILGLIGGDGEQPGPQRSAQIEARPAREKLQERLLKDVLHKIGLVEELLEKCVQTVPVAADDLAKRRFVALHITL